ncbi:putative glucosamine-fructose-6-phosphate aminotransferase [Trypanosoma theileri]|uniref:Putative glucosamine-fructose-6-phosphate aminotransferase n=1 Tax=Trypanosoma theileri TaxID=67003 RepID=A0A1X0NL83_9TRYP|nr:putative glucosamine-fructose-6-phosphate aminotransferase [Trypanosoma theileri]ORC85466.1 putative glucosamine-fructose-6-phosphate aminotransferase [Trypanosoma theileri]
MAWPVWLSVPFQTPQEKKEAAHSTFTFEQKYRNPGLPPLSLVRRKANTHSNRHVMQLLDELEAKSRVSTCWKNAIESLKEGCGSLRTDDGARSRLALRMASCDGESDGGHRSWPRCSIDRDSDIRQCVQHLGDAQYLVYAQYRLHTDVLCLYIQEEVFQERTEAVVKTLYAGAAAASETLQSLRDSSDELLGSVEEATRQQKSNFIETQRLYGQLQELRDGQSKAFESLRESTERVMQSVTDAGLSLSRMHVALDEGAAHAAAAVKEITRETAAFQSRTEAYASNMLQVLERVEGFQQSLVEGTMGIGAMFHCAILLLILLLFTIPARTAAARLPCIAVVCVAYAIRPFLPRTLNYALGATGGNSNNNNNNSNNIFFVFVTLVVGATLLFFAYTYRSPDQALRLVLRCEMRRVLEDTRGSMLEDVRQTVIEGVTEAMPRVGGFAGSHQQQRREESARLLVSSMSNKEEAELGVEEEENGVRTPPTVKKPRRRKSS